MTTKTLPNSTTTTYYYTGSGVTLVNNGVQGRPGASGMNFGFVISGNNDTLVNNGTAFGQRIGIYGTGSGDGIINAAGGQIIATYPDDGAVNFNLFVGTLTNYGTISGFAGATNGDGGNAVQFQQGGLVTNFGTLQGGGVLIRDSLGTVVNSGVILGNVAYGGVYLEAGGTITNRAGGLISSNGATESYRGGPPYGVFIAGGTGTVTNAGTIDGGSGYAVLFAAGTYQNRVIVDTGAVFVGTVNGGGAVYATLELASGASQGTLSGVGSQFINFGTLAFDPSASWRVDANTSISSTTITGFGATDTIDLAGFVAVSDTFSANTLVLTNAGGAHETLQVPGTFATANFTIANDGNGGTDLGFGTIAPADLVYGQTIDETGIVATTETVTAGVMTLFNGASPVGTIAVGTTLNTSDFTLRSDGSGGTDVIVSTVFGVYESGVTLLTNPTTIANTARVSETSGTALFGRGGSGWTINNYGVVNGGASAYGIQLGSGGSLVEASGITNAAGGSISGLYGIRTYNNANVNIVNLAGGTIASTGAGGGRAIDLEIDAGTVTNAGLITTQPGGAFDIGVELDGGGTVINTATGTITGGWGVLMQGAGTVINAGTISGVYTNEFAVAMNSGDRLIVDPGAVFVGAVNGARLGGSSTLELASAASAGTLSTTNFTNFSAIVFDAGATWTLQGNIAALGGTISGFTLGDTIDLAGFSAVSDTFASNTLVLTDAGGAHDALNVQGAFTSGNFALSDDGDGGTDIAFGTAPLLYGDTLDQAGIVATTETVTAGVVTLFNGGGTAVGSIAVGGTLDSSDFTLAPDGAGGTDVIVSTVFGTYTSGVTLLTNPTTIASTATASNTAAGGQAVTGPAGTTWTLVNKGLVSETASGGIGVSLAQAGTVINASGGLITAAAYGVILNGGGLVSNASGGTIIAVNDGVIALAAATVVNAGEITASSRGAVFLGQGGSVTNQSGGTITGADGVMASQGGATVSNAGYIDGAFGVSLGNGGLVTNQSGGTITGGTGVYTGYNPGTVLNAGYIKGTSANGVWIEGGGLVSNQSGGTITGIVGVYANVYAVSMVNAGTILAQHDAVQVEAGGYLTNQAGGTIIGFVGIEADNAAATVVNAGSILSQDAGGVELSAGGYLTNAAGGSIGGFFGLFITNDAATVVNAGTISGTGAGIEANTGVSVTNQSGGTIVGVFGIYAGNSTSVLNAGLIDATGAFPGIDIRAGGTVTNLTGGTIESSGGDAVSFESGYTNRLVIAPGATFIGMADGGNVVGGGSISTLELASAASAGTLSGLGATYVDFAQVVVDTGANWVLAGGNTVVAGATLTNGGTLTDAGTLTNAGLITGASQVILLDTGGLITNQSGGIIEATGTVGVAIGSSGAGTVVNAGQITGGMSGFGGMGVSLAVGGSITNQSGGTIAGFDGIYASAASTSILNLGDIAGNATHGSGIVLYAGGTVTNEAGASITGTVALVAFGTATVVNAGYIADSPGGVAVDLRGGGAVTNQSSGTLAGRTGVYAGAGVEVVNGGLIVGTASSGLGVYMYHGGSVTNLSGGTITGGRYGVGAAAAAVVVNAGTIAGTYGTGIGVVLQAGGTITNQAGGTISGGAGAVAFASSFTNRLVIDPGAVFSGLVDGGNTIGAGSISTLELGSGASTGTLTGFGSQYINFAQVTLDAGAQWDIVGSDATTALAGATISGFGYGDTIDVTNFAATGDGFSGNQLTLTNGGGTITLAIPGTFFSSQFRITNDGGSGTDITVQPLTLLYGDTLDEAGIVATSETVTGGVMTLYDGASPVGTIGVGGTLNTSDFILSPDGSSGTDVIVSTVFGTYANSGVTLLINPTTIAGTASITGTVAYGIGVTGPSGTAWTLVNQGLVSETGTASLGISFASAGTIINAAGGIVAGSEAGIALSAGGSVTNQSGGTISGDQGLYALTGAASVVNAGSIGGSVTLGSGIVLDAGGSITNVVGGTISGSYGVKASGAAATVVNAGSIGDGSLLPTGAAIALKHGGLIVNQAGGKLVAGLLGVYFGGAAGTIVNAGSVGGSTSNGEGIIFTTAGAVTNQSGGVITGRYGIRALSGAVTVVNAGSIGGNTASGSGVNLSAGGSLTNQFGGVITGQKAVNVASGTVTNAGSIGGTTAVAFGAGSANRLVYDPGAVFSGVVDGGNTIGATAVSTLELASGDAAGTLSGLGTQFTDFTNVTVDSGARWTLSTANTLTAGATLTNAGTLTATGTLVNAGTITGNRLDLSGGVLTNQASGVLAVTAVYGVAAGGADTVVNQGMISTGVGAAVYLAASGSITNAAGGVITGYDSGVRLDGSIAALTNLGQVIATMGIGSYGAYLKNGGVVINGQPGTGTISALIEGYYGVAFKNAAGALSNYGTILGDGGRAVDLSGAGSSLVNGAGGATGALIEAFAYGVIMTAGSVTNYASIIASSQATPTWGVDIETTGTVGNLGSVGLIEGYGGVRIGTNGTIINVGTIASNQGAGGVAVDFVGGNARLIDNPGAVFVGSIYGGTGGTAVLELASAASAGTIAGVGSTVTNFTSLVFDTGAQWTVAGNDNANGLGTLGIGGFTIGDTIDLTGFVAVSDTFASNTLVLTNGVGDHESLDIQGAFVSDNFHLTSDGNGGTDISFVTPPTIAAGGTVTFIGGGSPVTLDSTLGITSPDSTTLVSGTVSIGGFLSGDTLNFTDQDGITGNFDSATGSLTLTGSATLADYQAALDSITYGFTPADGDPAASGDTTRTIDWVVNDGTNASTVATSTLDTVHVAPTIIAGGTVSFTGGGGAVVLDSTLTVADPDSAGLLNAGTVSIGGFLSGDTLNFTDQDGIVGSFDTLTGTLTLTGSATLADYQAALDSITYGFSPADGDPTASADTTRTINWQVDDGTSASTVATSTLDTVHVAPTITVGGTVSFTGGGSAVALDSTLSLTDPDSGGLLNGGTVSVGGFLSGDTLNFTDQNGITGNFNSATGALTLTGSATLADYQAALDSITYSFNPTDGDPTGGVGGTSRTIDWVVTDGASANGVSNTGTSTLDVVRVGPTITAGGTVSYVADGPPSVLDPDVTITDVDSAGVIHTAMVSIGGGFTLGDLLNFTDQNGITGAYDSATGTLALGGNATIADYQAALDSITYAYTPDGGDPTAGGTDPTRAIAWTVDDGVDTSAAAFSTLDLSLPPPVISGTVAGQRTSDNIPIQPFSGVTIGDPNTGAVETVTITLTDGGTPTDADGTLSGSGLTETGTGTGTYTLAAGTPDAVTAALDALVFTPTLDDVIPYGTITTGMTLSVTDNLVGTPAADDTTTTVNSIACFAAGTRIATPRGAVTVERLREGDMVLTVSGKLRPVQWIGRRTLDCTRHITPERVKPVRIAPHAFGEDRPKRPLLLSPDHSVFIEDVMIPIKHLINGVTITRLDVATVTYYHIELESHDVVLAEGLPAETYLETGGRAAFENGGGAIDLHPDFEPDENRVGMVWQNFAYAPLIGSDGQLNRVRTRLTLQAAMLQHQASATPPRTKRPRRSARA